jgi:hypothetical protein
MEETNTLRPALEHYRAQRQKLLEQLRPIELMIRQLEKDLGESSSLSETPDVQDGIPSSFPSIGPLSNPLSKGLTIPVRPDQFFNMTQSDAAKAYLRPIGRAIPFAELVLALQTGGAKLGGADPSKTLYVSLARNPKKEFVWPSKDHISLSEFYDKKGSGT